MRTKREIETTGDPSALLPGLTVIAAPHMDDEVLACGGTISKLSENAEVHLVYATDGSRSPVPPFSWVGSSSGDLSGIREQEARRALAGLGVPESHLHFLRFPDSQLRQHEPALRRALFQLFSKVRPSNVLVPFRYDRHPDHLTLNLAAMRAVEMLQTPIQVLEYFVYYRWRLLPEKDVRAYVRPEQLVAVDIAGVSDLKRRALDCFASQTTRFFSWQDRPNLTGPILDEVCGEPELFLRSDARYPGVSVFTRAHNWIRFVHVVEPFVKRCKDDLLVLLRSGSRGNRT